MNDPHTVRFVQDIEKHPSLYNYSLPEYSQRHSTELAWKAIAKKHHMTVSECKEKWRNLRTTFSRKLKGSLTGTGPMKQYYLHDHMKFIIPFIKVLKQTSDNNVEVSNLIKTSTIPNEETETENHEEDTNHTLMEEKDIKTLRNSEDIEIVYMNNLKKQELEDEDDDEEEDTNYNTIEERINRKRRKNRVDTSYVNYLRESLLDKETSLNSDHHRKYFLLSLLEEISQFDMLEMRTFKRKSLQLIEDIFAARKY